jgi:PAS domain-containing protein
MGWQLKHARRRRAFSRRLGFSAWAVAVCLLGPVVGEAGVAGAEVPGAIHFRQNVEPVLREYCYDCHGDGMNKGDMALDQFESDTALLGAREQWWKVLKYLRSGLMPPQNKPRPTEAERQRIAQWIKADVFGIDPQHPDPGRVTVRRLNRVEYRNTIHDLVGVDFNSEVEFPADDTGYGFDNIGDVLTVSPMLLEKYVAAAKEVVAEAVPTVAKVVPEKVIGGDRFRGTGVTNGVHAKAAAGSTLSMSFYQPAAVTNSFNAQHAGSYELTLELAVKGTFDFDPGKCRVNFRLDDQPLLREEFGWHDFKAFRREFTQKLESGKHAVTFELQPLTPPDQKLNALEMRLVSLKIRGPMEPEYWTRPKNYDRFFTQDAPKDPAERRQYARTVLERFAGKAFRRPVDDRTLDRLTALAENVYNQPGKPFEEGVAYAMVAVLASPRFLFRLERSVPDSSTGASSLLDEYSLASRLSYFLWSTMPDDELFGLAKSGELRQQFAAQVKRMMADPRSEAMVENFVGQWLQVRDLEGTSIDARVVLARDNGQEQAMRQAQEAFRKQLAERQARAAAGQTNAAAAANPERPLNRGRFFRPRVELDRELRQAMKRETEMFFADLVQEDRSVTDLIDGDYTFLNEKLANFYGLTNIDVKGAELRRVTLPADSPRGGILTQGSVLVVTSNPDRTSPVKRGLFVLDNILGTPAPPPPPNVPALEASEKDFKDHQPTLRETLELHRSKALCASCHARMDPIGLGMENFNAMGMWREKERGQTIDTAGKLITGESFTSVQELKQILATEHRRDFYRCLTEKLLTYALGRGPEYYDVETVDQIVQRLERENGRFSALLMGILESAPFQRQRNHATAIASPGESSSPREAKQIAKIRIQP